MDKSQLTRIVELDRQIRERYYPSIRRFSKEYEVSERTIRRDIDFLTNSLNAPLAYDPTRKGYSYTESWEFPKILTTFANRAHTLFQLIKHLKALSPDDRQYVIDQATLPPRPPAPPPTPAGIMTFATSTLPMPARPPKKHADLIAQIRNLNNDERQFVLKIV